MKHFIARYRVNNEVSKFIYQSKFKYPVGELIGSIKKLRKEKYGEDLTDIVITSHGEMTSGEVFEFDPFPPEDPIDIPIK